VVGKLAVGMMRFTVYDENGPAQEWPLVGAHLLGPEDLAVAGQIKFKSPEIVCRKQGSQTTALCLQFDAGRVGRLMLQTCLLPDRERPYILSVELARHRIKTFLAKSEEWQIFELDPEHPAIRTWEKARKNFTQAITAPDPREADRIAREALVLGVEATELLALSHAEILLHRRYAQRPASSATLGVRVWPDREGKSLRELVAKEFDVLQIPLRWRHQEVEEGKYRWDQLDRWIDWARDVGKPVVAGPLLDFSKRSLPKWMYVWQHDYDTCRDLAYDHVERVVKRYKSTVGMWNLAAGLSTNENFQFTPEQMIDLVRMTSLVVKQSTKRSRTMIEVVQPFGEACARHRNAVAPLAFIERLLQEGIKVDAVGVQVLMGAASAGRATRDLMKLSSLLDRFFYLEIPVLLSAVGVPSKTIDPKGGYWHRPWDEHTQAKWGSRILAMALSKPFVETVFWADLYDHDEADLPASGLIDPAGRPRPVLHKLVQLRHRLRKPLGKLRSKSLANLMPT